MADDESKPGVWDGALMIDVAEDHCVRDWAEALGASPDVPDDVVNRVGPAVDTVRRPHRTLITRFCGVCGHRYTGGTVWGDPYCDGCMADGMDASVQGSTLPPRMPVRRVAPVPEVRAEPPIARKV